MENDFGRMYQELARLDPVHGLDQRSFRITPEGAGILEIPIPDYRVLGLGKKQLLDLYSYMALARSLDNELENLRKQSIALGKHLPAHGNEATAVGASYVLEEGDWMSVAIRDLGAFLVRGFTPSEILAQACGRVDGPTKGWDGSLHFGDIKRRVLGLISHLGTMVPVAAGCAFAEKYYRETDRIALAFCGDGATSTGDVPSALNLAAVLHVPLALVVENNQWAFGTPTARQFTVPTLALRALGLGQNVAGYLIDGTNVITVYGTVKEAIERARREGVISIIETRSMRMKGHSLADPFARYVPQGQLAAWEAKDPIRRHREFLLAEGLASTDELDAIDARIKREIAEASDVARKSSKPVAQNIETKMFDPSPQHPITHHEPPTGERFLTYREAILEGIMQEMRRDENLFIIGEDIGISNGPFHVTEGLLEIFDGLKWQDHWEHPETFCPRRVIDATLAESAFTGFAAGAAHAGLRAIVEYQFADFSSDAFKMIVNYLATQAVRGFGPLHVVLRMPAGWAHSGSVYHCVNPESWFASTPGLKIVAPITAFDAKGLLNAAIRDGNPVLYLEYKDKYNIRPGSPLLPAELRTHVPEEDYVVPIGKARILKRARTGKDIKSLTVVSYGSQVFRALDAAHAVEEEMPAASIEVIDLRTIIPYDGECIAESLRRTNRVLVTCEAPEQGCFGNELVKFVTRKENFEHLDAPPALVAAANTVVPFAPELEEAHLPTTEKVANAIRELLAY